MTTLALDLVSASQPAPTTASLFSQWSVQPLALVAAVVAAIWWWRAVATLRRRGVRWPSGRSALFAIGLSAFLWTTNGFPQAYSNSVFAAWLSQSLLLLLVIPGLLMTAQPVALARLAYGPKSLLIRVVASALGRVMSSPFVGPAIVPVICAALFFGSAPGWVVQYEAVDWPLTLVLTLVGAMIVLPLVGTEYDGLGSLAVGVALGVGLFELLIDAVPGIVLRLQTTISSSFFDHRMTHPWSVSALTDQQSAGGILWGAAELLDLPFLLLIFRRWVIADAHDAAQIDTVLDAERISRAALKPQVPAGPGTADTEFGGPSADADQPWWLNDPVMRDRVRRRK